jgi:hypothetical protein
LFREQKKTDATSAVPIALMIPPLNRQAKGWRDNKNAASRSIGTVHHQTVQFGAA